MKKTNYLIALFLVSLFISCSQNNDIETAVDENLPEISTKLRLLSVSSINLDIPDIFNKDASKKQKRASNNLITHVLKKDFSKKLNAAEDACKHKITEVIEFGNTSHTLTQKFFNAEGESITDCVLEELLADVSFTKKFILETNQILTKLDTTYTIDQRTLIETSIIPTSLNSATFKLSAQSSITGSIDLDGDFFYILEGSSLALKISSNTNSDGIDLDEIIPEIDFNLNIGFPVNGEDYHFTLKVNSEDLFPVEQNHSNIIAESNLLNSKNQKIGTIKYDLGASYEHFLLYDLNGNLVY